VARKRHQDKDIEKLLVEAEANDWLVIISPKGYWKLRCTCERKHYRTVHLTPSGSNYAKNLASWLKRQPCWPKMESR
jgi:hypothetical protein